MQLQAINSRNSIEDDGPKSSCSIESPRKVRQHKVLFHEGLSQRKIAQNQGVYSDRFLPMRNVPKSSQDLHFENVEWLDQEVNEPGVSVSDIYKNELLGENYAPENAGICTFANRNILKFSHQSALKSSKSSIAQLYKQGLIPNFGDQEHKVPAKNKDRKISKNPAKVLDAPALYDDFYLNLVDWSTHNLLAVGLGNCVYLWNAGNSKVVRLVELPNNDAITSTSSSVSSNILGVGTHLGEVQLWDCIKHRKVQTFLGHTGRVGAIAWNSNNIFASGSRDKSILVRDIRVADPYISKLVGHKQEVCGLKWSFDQQQLASGGNDNRLNIWSPHSLTPSFSILKHTAAVKALAWSPHQHGLLVSGGGTADKTIRFWNSVTGEETKCMNVGSQVCNLMFAKTVNELVSTHGYSLNEINIWSMPKMEKIETLTGHTYRVLYLAMSPDGTTIVTGAGDETLRFWNVFPPKEKNTDRETSLGYDSICLR